MPMYLRDLLAGMRRRWLLALSGLLVTAAGAWFVFAAIPPTYTASASVMVMPPESSTVVGGNPFLNLSGMGAARDVLTRRVDADVVRLPLERDFPDAEYVVYADNSTSGPMIVAEVTESTSAKALAVLDRVLRELRDSMDAMQADLAVPQASRMTLTEVAVDRRPERDTSTRNQLTIAVAGAGLVATVLLTGFVDGLVLARRARRSAVAADAASEARAADAVAEEPSEEDRLVVGREATDTTLARKG